ncbi:MAG: sensor domain-containing diguanylate cyclase [Sphingomonadaceae bacterium]|nr:sensor domain-containing diguanylate cyclase [Sphingomonadaceae bacterium]
MADRAVTKGVLQVFDPQSCATESVSAFKRDEAGRLSALMQLDVLDSATEQPFESIADLVRQVLKVPICAVSLVDVDRQWFKARRGLDVTETARDFSFCTHAINGTVPFIVADATKDPLFSNNPLVTGGPKIRSYAGIPLTTPDGYNIGTLCAIDIVPRKFSKDEISILASFANVVVGEIELRQIASTDVLTGILTRRAWIDCAEREVRRASACEMALSILIIDIDHFKAVNDRFGHPVGDQVIREIAHAVQEQLREFDWFGRFGGEEFVAALPDTNLTDASNIAEGIRAAISGMRLSCLGDQACTISIGVAKLGHNETRLKSVLNRVDHALFQAKRLGRDRIQVADNVAIASDDRAAA